MNFLQTFSSKILANKTSSLLFCSIIGVLIFYISKDYGMFWDNVLFASKMGTHLYNNSLFNWTFPNSFDPGHPPFLGFLLALFWSFFERNLYVSHLVMLPFIVGVLYQILQTTKYYFKSKTLTFLAFLLLIADPTLATQFVLVNPEVIIIFFFLLAFNGFIQKNKTLQFIGLFFLSITSFRGMMLFAGFFLFDIINKLYIERKKISLVLNFKFFAFYFFASLPGTTFVIWRLYTKGWLQTHPDSPWATLWQFANGQTFIKNSIVLFHRYFDFGRVFIFVFLIFSTFYFGKKVFHSKRNQQLLLISITSVICIAIVSLISTNHFGHRYFIISFLFFILLAFSIIKEYIKHKKIVYSLLLIGLITGNLWIYPREIAQGWDATLAHIPYHLQRKKAIQWLNNNAISIESVATFFPNKTTIDNIELNNDYRRFSEFNGENSYVLYSDVYNLSDENYAKLDKNYTLLKQFNNNNINTTIYINNDNFRRKKNSSRY